MKETIKLEVPAEDFFTWVKEQPAEGTFNLNDSNVVNGDGKCGCPMVHYIRERLAELPDLDLGEEYLIAAGQKTVSVYKTRHQTILLLSLEFSEKVYQRIAFYLANQGISWVDEQTYGLLQTL